MTVTYNHSALNLNFRFGKIAPPSSPKNLRQILRVPHLCRCHTDIGS